MLSGFLAHIPQQSVPENDLQMLIIKCICFVTFPNVDGLNIQQRILNIYSMCSKAPMNPLDGED